MLSPAAGLLLLALLGQPQPPRTYYWRDAAGQTHVTNTPPPPDAILLESPPPSAVEAQPPAGRVVPARQRGGTDAGQPLVLTEAQRKAWAALDTHLTQARALGSRRTLEAAADSLVDDCLWGSGLWAMPVLPALALALMGLMGWWLAIGLRPDARLPLVGGFLLLGLAFGHLILNIFVYHPQAVRLRQNLELLELHMGAGRPPRPERRALLQRHYQALEQAAEPTEAPWRFPREVQALRAAVKQVMVEP